MWRFVPIFVLLFGGNFAEIEISHENYTKIILKVHECSKSSSLFLFHSDAENLRNDFQGLAKMRHLFAKLSEKYITVSVLQLSELAETINKYKGRIPRPLFVVLLSTEKSVKQLNILSDKAEISFPKWLLIFATKLHNLCSNPEKNLQTFYQKTKAIVICGKNLESEKFQTEISSFDTLDPEILCSSVNLKNYKTLNGTKITVGIVSRDEMVLDKNGKLQGFFGELLRELQKGLNFSVGLYVVEDSYGIKNMTNGQWNGAMGHVISGKVDIGLGTYIVVKARLEIVDYLYPLRTVRPYIYIRIKSKSAHISWFSYFKIYEYGVWIMIFLTILTSAILVSMMKSHRQNELSFLHNFHNTFVVFWGVMCQQGNEEKMKKWFVRIVTLSVFVTSMILYSYYSAWLVSHLVADIKTTLPFASMQEFVEVKSHKLTTMKNTAWHGYVMSGKTENAKQLKKLLVDVFPTTNAEALHQVCKKDVAYWRSEIIFRSEIYTVRCAIGRIHVGHKHYIGLVVPKNSLYRETLNHQILKLREDGTFDRLWNKFGYEKGHLDEYFIDEENHGWKSVAPIFVMLVLGVLSGIVIYVMEKLFSIAHKKLINKNHSL